MNTTFLKSFERDLKRIKDTRVLDSVLAVIEEVEKASDPKQIGDLKKMKGSVKHYRIRVGEYRIGIKIEGDVVVFMRCLHRRDIYRDFP